MTWEAQDSDDTDEDFHISTDQEEVCGFCFSSCMYRPLVHLQIPLV